MKRLFILLLALTCMEPAFACTSMIISSRASATGRPVMYKHRDAGELNNRIERFKGPKYEFIGLVNAPSKGGEVWTGTNSVGFSIMNTASYNIKDDNVPDSKMDQEGVVMYKALGQCATLADFEHLLDVLPRPMGVEANFGVIDAQGGAAYYEVNNHKWIKYDVNAEPSGYRVVTNFSFAGRPKDAEGVERYETATAIMKELTAGGAPYSIGHKEIVNSFSRSYRHERLGIDLINDLPANGIFVDQDFIPRRSTAASIIVEGVAPGENPLHTVMWTLIGHPACGVMMPLMVGQKDVIPSYLKKGEKSNHCEACDMAMSLKKKYIFDNSVSNGTHYFHADVILNGTEGRPSLLQCARDAEVYIDTAFGLIFDKWVKGDIKDNEFYEKYASISTSFLDVYRSKFVSYLKFD